MSYRSFIFAGTLLTGVSGLIYQVVWQKYLTFVVGSESRSVALVVAVFLAGLAGGYRFWGKYTQHVRERAALLRMYGAIEIAIGVYAALFPLWLSVLRSISHHTPGWVLTDLLITIAAVGLPTFCMGSTIPLLVSVVPETAEEVHHAHARIYGINTLGACVGSFGASFLLIPTIGLPGSLWLGCALNLVVGGLFLTNRLDGSLADKAPIETIANRFSPGTLYLYTLVTGAVTLSLEVLVVRVMNLTVGPGPHNFAIVVGVFILGLAIGSLSVGRRMSVGMLYGALCVVIAYLIVVYFSIPFWPYWLSNARALLTEVPAAYWLYTAITTGFLTLILLPFLVPLGFMLPLVYALLPKNTEDYGRKCGWLYFWNTVGTALGAVVLSHLLLEVLDLDGVFRVVLALLGLLGLRLCMQERRVAPAIVAVAGVACLFAPAWNRDSHYEGLFRGRSVNSFNFQGWFRTPRLAPEDVRFFDDGPDATVAVMHYERAPDDDPSGRFAAHGTFEGYGLAINGKGDGDTVGDYSTITLAAMIPYLHAPARGDLEAAVIGLGTGITAAVLAGAEDVAHVTTAEISSTLVEALPEFRSENHDLTNEPKADIVPMDGYKYFARVDRPLDIVVSASSPPWVVGVENLFTPEFYRLAAGAMRDDGVFLQWFPLYSMSGDLLRTIIGNVHGEFPHLRLFAISENEFGLLGSREPLPARPSSDRFAEPFLRQVREKMHFTDPDMLEFLVLYREAAIDDLLREDRGARHSMSWPSLSYVSDRIRFLDVPLVTDSYLDAAVRRRHGFSPARREAFDRLVAAHPRGVSCTSPFGAQHFCFRINPLIGADRQQAALLRHNPAAALTAYDLLRNEGLRAADPDFLLAVREILFARGQRFDDYTERLLVALARSYRDDGRIDDALTLLDDALERGIIDSIYHDRARSDLTEV